MPLKTAENNKTPLKGVMKRTSIMSQAGINTDTKSP